MPSLHRYNVRFQCKRTVYVDAKNEQHAKELAIQDVEDMGGTEKISANQVNMTFENTGVSAQGGVPLNGYEVNVRYRMNFVTDAVDMADAVHWAKDYQTSWIDTDAGEFQRQTVTFMRENTGVA